MPDTVLAPVAPVAPAGTVVPPGVPSAGTNVAPVIPGVAPVAPVVPVVPPTTLFSEGVNFSENWQQTLPEDFRDDPSLVDYKDFHSLVKSTVHLKKMMGNDKVAIPNENSDESAWNEYYSKGGRPDTPAEYALKAPEGFEFRKEQIDSYQNIFHKIGVSKKGAEELFQFRAQELMAEDKADQDQSDADFIQAGKDLRQEYGMAFEDKIRIAHSVQKKYDPDGSLGILGLLNDPRMTKVLVAIGEDLKATLSEDDLGDSFNGPMTPNQIQIKIDEMSSDKNGPLMNASHVNHAQALQQWQNLIAMQK